MNAKRLHILHLRYNLDPFNQYTDSALWSALERAHLKEKIAGEAKQLEMVCFVVSRSVDPAEGIDLTSFGTSAIGSLVSPSNLISAYR